MSQVKFNRRYELTLQGKDGLTYTIRYPMTLEFQVTRNNLASVCSASFTVYNASPSLREVLVKDRMNPTDFRAVKFAAGYDGFMPVVFEGEIRMMQSVRSGPNFLTQIECWSGGFDMSLSKTELSWPATSKTTLKEILITAMGKFTKLKPPVVGKNFTQTPQRQVAMAGNTAQIIKELVGYRFHIDNQVPYCLDDNECLLSSYRLIDDSSGILETPRRQDKVVDVAILFEPRLQVNQMIALETYSGRVPGPDGKLVGRPSQWNGTYKVIGVTHNGTISAVECGQCVTTVSLLSPTGTLSVVGNI